MKVIIILTLRWTKKDQCSNLNFLFIIIMGICLYMFILHISTIKYKQHLTKSWTGCRWDQHLGLAPGRGPNRGTSAPARPFQTQTCSRSCLKLSYQADSYTPLNIRVPHQKGDRRIHSRSPTNTVITRSLMISNNSHLLLYCSYVHSNTGLSFRAVLTGLPDYSLNKRPSPFRIHD